MEVFENNFVSDSLLDIASRAEKVMEDENAEMVTLSCYYSLYTKKYHATAVFKKK